MVHKSYFNQISLETPAAGNFLRLDEIEMTF